MEKQESMKALGSRPARELWFELRMWPFALGIEILQLQVPELSLPPYVSISRKPMLWLQYFMEDKAVANTGVICFLYTNP